ncbi:hypothetical protein COOONC_22152 [Cooperia oncophora]
MCTVCGIVVGEIQEMVDLGGSIETAIREKCEENTPKFMVRTCQKFLHGLTKLGDKLKKQDPEELCGTLHVCGGSDDDEDDEE